MMYSILLPAFAAARMFTESLLSNDNIPLLLHVWTCLQSCCLALLWSNPLQYLIQQIRPFSTRSHVTAVVMGLEIREGNIIEALPQRCNVDKLSGAVYVTFVTVFFLSLSALQFLNLPAFTHNDFVKCCVLRRQTDERWPLNENMLLFLHSSLTPEVADGTWVQ
jgi:hypothetical protein